MSCTDDAAKMIAQLSVPTIELNKPAVAAVMQNLLNFSQSGWDELQKCNRKCDGMSNLHRDEIAMIRRGFDETRAIRRAIANVVAVNALLLGVIIGYCVHAYWLK